MFVRACEYNLYQFRESLVPVVDAWSTVAHNRVKRCRSSLKNRQSSDGDTQCGGRERQAGSASASGRLA